MKEIFPFRYFIRFFLETTQIEYILKKKNKQINIVELFLCIVLSEEKRNQKEKKNQDMFY